MANIRTLLRVTVNSFGDADLSSIVLLPLKVADSAIQVVIISMIKSSYKWVSSSEMPEALIWYQMILNGITTIKPPLGSKGPSPVHTSTPARSGIQSPKPTINGSEPVVRQNSALSNTYDVRAQESHYDVVKSIKYKCTIVENTEIFKATESHF
ncbi:hypothetical protein WN51_01246 [Melipona quadrifasciata]|uniref:Uncharacterized protein n=1 Tax=Melipona quadrifasciata TaxID=166423 RepID=A0A0M9A0U2_9HYME|nr:hypothetical protein WN51_01246 [Melipona quadrifasciata]